MNIALDVVLAYGKKQANAQNPIVFLHYYLSIADINTDNGWSANEDL